MENLRQLFGAYLYQSWDSEFASQQDAIREFVNREPDAVQPAISEAEVMLATMTESELERTMIEFGYWDAPPVS